MILKHPDIDSVYLTSPTYEGLICSYDEVREAIGPNRKLIIDEAHGSHLYFLEPSSGALMGALQSGVVDVSVASIHKNLGAIAGAALLNVGKDSRISPDSILNIYQMLATTTPSPYVLYDIEGCVRDMSLNG